MVVANGARVHPLSWMRVHVSRRFEVSDVDPMSASPRCTAARAAVDAASWKPQPRVGCAILAAAVQQGLVTPAQTREQIHESGAIRHRRILLAALADIEGGSHALAEIDLIRLCRRAGLPKPQQQVVRRDSSGRRRYLDARLVRPDGRVILIEVDGAVHLNVAHWWDDQLRSNDLVITDDAIIIRIPAVILAHRPATRDRAP